MTGAAPAPAARSLLRTRIGCAAAALTIAVQAAPHVSDLLHDRYAPGAAWEPRVKAILDVSRVATLGGPYLALPAGPAFEPVDRKVNDLGYSALGYAWGRWTGRPLGRRGLMLLNLIVLVAALLALLASMPLLPGLLSAAVLLAVPIPTPEYRSPDPLATHASLALLGIVLAAAMARRWPIAAHAALGVVLFAVHKVRSAYALYALPGILLVAAAESLRGRSPKPLLRVLAAASALAALEAGWQGTLRERARDPRVVQQDTLGTHPIYIALLEGVGWTENRWGLKPADPWVASYLADRFGLEPVDVGTAESERRARIAYAELWREAPLHLLAVYLRRLPDTARDHVFLGGFGGAALVIAVPSALLLGWRSRDPALPLLLAAGASTACVLFQTLVLDPRLLYAYPLRITSGLTLALALAILARACPGFRPADMRRTAPFGRFRA